MAATWQSLLRQHVQFERALTNDFGSPANITVNPITNKIYVANRNCQLKVIDGVTHETHNLYTRLFDTYGTRRICRASSKGPKGGG